MPVLLVLGVDEDGQGEAEMGRRLVQAMPDGESVTLDVAHLAAFHRVDLTLPVFARFLDDVSERS